jgi:hypothetical protein
VVATLDTPAIQERLKTVGTTVAPPDKRSPQFLKTFLDAEIAKWAVIIKASGVSLD